MTNSKTKLAAIMAKKNINQHELARMTGIPQPTINVYCLDKQEPRVKNLKLMALALGVKMSELLEGDDE